MKYNTDTEITQTPDEYNELSRECSSHAQHTLECPHERWKVCCVVAQTFGDIIVCLPMILPSLTSNHTTTDTW